MIRTLPYVLDQGLRGHHHLFDLALLRDALSRAPAAPDGSWLEGGIDPNVARDASALLDDLEDDEDLGSQRARIARAPREVQELLVLLYFRYLYGYLESRSPHLH